MKDLSFDNDMLIKIYQPDFAVAYGSGVFAQNGYTAKDKPMIDIIFGVEDTRDWHKKRHTQQYNDYGNLASILGPWFSNWLQRFGAGINYYPYIDFKGTEIKYGVISKDRLVSDLKNWDTIYVAGRLHKPVAMLKSDEEMDAVIHENLEHAVNTALFLLPQKFKEQELYIAITSISYMGDSRMRFGENPQKIINIVNKNIEGFHELYWDIIKRKKNITVLNGDDLQQDISPMTRGITYGYLPEKLRNNNRGTPNLANAEQLRQQIMDAITSIVRTSSTSQTIKGVFTAGTQRSTKYFFQKLKKGRKNN